MPRLRADNQWLNGPQRAALRKCLADAFDATSFAQMIYDHRSIRLDRLVATTAVDFDTIIDRTIQKADEQSWSAEFLAAAQAERPDDPCLPQFAEQLASTPAPPAATAQAAPGPGLPQARRDAPGAPLPGIAGPPQSGRARPVVLLAFANDRSPDGRYLSHLPDEINQLQALWEPVAKDGRGELLLRTNVTVERLFTAFQDYRNQIAIFHFAGHGSSYALLLEGSANTSAVANAGGLAAFLAGQAGLQLVFLNACSTQAQAEALHAAGVPVVIATRREIDDGVAVEFAAWFHRALVSGASIRQAFDEAAAAVKTAHGDNPRHLYTAENDAAESAAWPWAIYVRPGATANWVLPAAQAAAQPAAATPGGATPTSLRTGLIDLLANAPGMEAPDARRGLLNYIGFGYLTQVLDLTGAPLPVAARLVATIAGSGKAELSRFLVGLQGWQGFGMEQKEQLASMAQAVAGLSEGAVKAEFVGGTGR